jgi:hypothetical protein
MMKYTILEDCSPYYIRFTYTGIESVIDQCSRKYYNYDTLLDLNATTSINKNFVHHKVSPFAAQNILKAVPMSDVLDICETRVSLFISRGGCMYRPHKDGLDVRCGINYNVHIKDDLCVTGWYNDEQMSDYSIDTLGGRSREINEFDASRHSPDKTMTAVEGECVLFNTDIYHGWDNGRSENTRVLLTLRFNHPRNLYFENVRKILFGY